MQFHEIPVNIPLVMEFLGFHRRIARSIGLPSEGAAQAPAPDSLDLK